ncbi:acetate--CoA ligase family protein [Thermococcus thioreducens]|uniref:acetate--CoA ligase (ADP-forming) n=1 Tax=Thermococcus thioreducens TaxID=277988 RepID=A0A0Q2QTT2_9EURY|nr:CoA-binding protein [Thermococcus thioreducens]ASJ11401.1 CoA-binding protein [Thermococcus thioreducens]KQH83421.1 CoA-binding protein [Thermococcus thioreducens]SEW07344.1 acetyl coenzyme A synthetase (ADP forming), alpha domain-containing protein [Thermococcus thioreducens]
MEAPKLDFLFYPRSVAVIGASNVPGKIGNSIMRSITLKFDGKVYAVNVKGGEVEVNGKRFKVYRSIREIPDEIDVAVIAVPAKFVPDVIDECGEKGVKGAVVISAGFKEAGRVELEEELVRRAKKWGIRLVGPNCLGVTNLENGFDCNFNPPERQARPPAGKIAFMSQSGAFGAAILDWAANHEIGMSKFISLGNMADLDESDFIAYLGEDEKTGVITGYIEGVKDGRKFFNVAKEVTLKKPIIVLKAGRTEAGAKAAASHTGSLAGSYKIYEAAFEQTGVLSAKSMRQLFNYAKALAMQKPAKGNRVAIVTNGGGAGVMMSDGLLERGMKLAELSDETNERFRKDIEEGKLPHHMSYRNPIDVIGDAPSSRYELAMRYALEDPNVDVLVVIALFQSPALDEGIVEAMVRMGEYGKPIVFVAPGGDYPHRMARRMEKEAGVPVYETVEDGVDAVYALVKYGEWLRENEKL